MGCQSMERRKREIVEALKKKNIDIVKVEKEVVNMLRNRASSVEVQKFLQRVIEGGEKA